MPGGSEMTAKLKPGAVVRSKEEASSFRGHGVITSERERGGEQVVSVLWTDGARTDQPVSEVELTGFHTTLKAGDSWNAFTIEEIDLTAEVMKVRVFADRPAPWIDVRLFGMPSLMVEEATEARVKWLEADRQKLDWFKPGQIVKGENALARPATVIRQVDAASVEVITSNGVAIVPFGELQLHSLSVQDLQAKEAQKRQDVLAAFQQEVREKAMDAKDEHDLCDDGVKEFLSSLGIKIPVNKVRAVLHLTVEVDAVVAAGAGMNRLNLDHGNNREWWGNTLRFDDDGKDLQFKDDDDLDMSELEVRLIEQTVVEIHDESYMEGE